MSNKLVEDIISLYPNNFDQTHNRFRMILMEEQLDILVKDPAIYNRIIDAIEKDNYNDFYKLVKKYDK